MAGEARNDAAWPGAEWRGVGCWDGVRYGRFGLVRRGSDGLAALCNGLVRQVRQVRLGEDGFVSEGSEGDWYGR